MTLLFGILLTLVVFTIIVFIHELGHFVTARWTGMKVEEFGIGIPPKAKILGKDAKGTEYTLNWLPIGGFVRIKGEDPGAEDSLSKDAFSSKKWWARSLVLLAGVTMNFILSIVIITVLFIVGVSPLMPNVFSQKDYNSYFFPSEKIALKEGYLIHEGIRLDPLTGSLAEKSGIVRGDLVAKINGVPVASIDDVLSGIQNQKTLVIGIKRDEGIQDFVVTPDNGKIGTIISYKNLQLNENYSQKLSLYDALIAGPKEAYYLSIMTFDLMASTLRKLIFPNNEQEKTEARESIAGPIGMGAGFVSMVKIGIDGEVLAILIALISINLGVLNILPFPALDGGRLVSTTIRSIVGLFTNKSLLMNQIEYSVHAFGMIILLILSLCIAFLDVSKLF